jgi:cardiolipin synthase
MLADCAAAKKSISLEQFIFVNDDLGRKMIDICAERAKAGVKVRFLWDAAGSFSFFGAGTIRELRDKGIQLVFWKTLVPSYFKVPDYRAWYLRNHRRTLVIDNDIAYTGSMAVSDSMRNWRDTNARFTGPVVDEMSNAFERMWLRAQHSKHLPRRIRARDPEFRYVTNQPRPGRRHITAALIEALRSAKHYVYITTPYFVPTRRMLRVIKLAAHRGVDVKIILPEKTDHYPTLDIAARSYFTTLLKTGVRIFLYQGNIIHSKAVVVDGTWSTVGSLNLDNASLSYNFEANIVTTNSRFAEELSAHFVHDLKDSKEILYKEWKGRFFIERIPEMLIRLVSKFL